MHKNGRQRVRRRRGNLNFMLITSLFLLIRYEFDETMEEEVSSDENANLNAAVFQEIRDQLQDIAVSPRRNETDYVASVVPPGETGVIFTTNEREDMTPLTINLDEPMGNALSRAVGNNRFHFELKDGTQLDNSKTFRQAGIDFGTAIRLWEGSNDSGYFGTPLANTPIVSPARSDASDVTVKELVEDRMETEQDLDKHLASAMQTSGTIVVTQPDNNLREMNVDNNDAVHQIIARAVGTTDNEEFELHYEGRVLPRQVTFRDTGIRFRSSLKLVERQINVFVRCVDSKNHCIQARRSDTVEFVKTALRDITQVPLHQHRLTFASKPLEDHFRLSVYGIKNNSQIESSYRLRGGAAF